MSGRCLFMSAVLLGVPLTLFSELIEPLELPVYGVPSLWRITHQSQGFDAQIRMLQSQHRGLTQIRWAVFSDSATKTWCPFVDDRARAVTPPRRSNATKASARSSDGQAIRHPPRGQPPAA